MRPQLLCACPFPPPSGLPAYPLNSTGAPELLLKYTSTAAAALHTAPVLKSTLCNAATPSVRTSAGASDGLPLHCRRATPPWAPPPPQPAPAPLLRLPWRLQGHQWRDHISPPPPARTCEVCAPCSLPEAMLHSREGVHF